MYGPYKAFWWLRGTGCSSGSAGAHSARRTSRATIIIGRAETKSDMTFKTSFVEPSSWTEPLTAYIQNTAHNNTHMRASLIFVYISIYVRCSSERWWMDARSLVICCHRVSAHKPRHRDGGRAHHHHQARHF